MTLTQLSYLVAVATHGHFGRAAEATHVTQPTLSMQIRKLEDDLGVVLLDRSRTPVVPTELGERIVEQARVVLREAERLPELVEEARGEVAGELRVGVLPTLGPYLLPRLLPRLVDAYPLLRLRIEELLTATILERLRADTLDAGLIASFEPVPGLQHRVLFEEPFVAYVGAGHAQAGEAAIDARRLRPDEVWVLSETHCLRDQVLSVCRPDASDGGHRPVRGIQLESGNLETLKRLVEHGGGVTLLPALAAPETPPSAARVVPLTRPVPARSVVLVRRRAHLKRQLVEAFAEQLLASLPDLVSGPVKGGPV